MLDLGKDAKGRRDRKKVTGKTRKEVADRLAEIRAKADEGLNVKANMTVGELLDEFYEEQKATASSRKLKPQTLQRKCRAKDQIKAELGAIKLDRVTDRDVTKAYANLAPMLAEQSLTHVRSILVER